MKTKLGPDHPGTLQSMGNLAGGYVDAGKLDKALPLYEETLALQKTNLGPDHPHTLTSMGNLAGGYRATGKLDRALPLFEETLALQKTKLGPDHPATLTSMASLAAGYWSMKRLDKSVPLFEEVLKRQEDKLGRDHPDSLVNVANLGSELQGCRPAQGSDPTPRRSPSSGEKISNAQLGGRPIDRRLYESGRERQARQIDPGTVGRGSQDAAQRQPQLAGTARPDRYDPPPTEEMDRGRAAPPRVPGHPREDGAR